MRWRPTARTLSLLWVLCAAVNAAAEEQALLLDATNSACPGRDQVARALPPVLPGSATLLSADDPRSAGALRLRVSDYGSWYRIDLGGATRDFSDLSRACDARARNTAVFVAIVLQQQRAPNDSPAQAPADQMAPSPAPAESSLEAPALTYTRSTVGRPTRGLLSAGFDVAGGPPGTLTAGGSLRASALWGSVGAGVGVGVLAPLDLAYDVATARVMRIPIDVSAIAELGMGRVRGSLALGLALDAAVVSGEGLASSRTAVGVAPGVRLGAGLRLRTGSIWPSIEVAAVWLPVPLSVSIEPDGVVGRLPAWWLGVSLGLAVPIPCKEVTP